MADTLTIVDTGKKYFNDLLTAKETPENIVLGLFVNDATITDSTVIGDLTAMSTHGITTKTLTGSSWAASAINGSGQAASAYAAQDFTATATDDGTQTDVYGYYAKSASGGVLLWAVKFASSKPITYENEKISITPEIRYDQA